MHSLPIEQEVPGLPLSTAEVEASHTPLRHLRFRVVREHVRTTAEGVVLRDARPVAGKEFPFGRPFAPVDFFPVRHPHRDAPVFLIRITPGVPPEALAIGQIGVTERGSNVLGPRAPRSLDGAVPTRLVRSARRDMHAELLAHRCILAGDKVWRIVGMEVREGPLAVRAGPCEEEPRAFCRLGATLGVLQIEAVEA